MQGREGYCVEVKVHCRTPRPSTFKESLYNIMIECENGEITYEPLVVITADDPVICAVYAIEKGLLKLDGWK